MAYKTIPLVFKLHWTFTEVARLPKLLQKNILTHPYTKDNIQSTSMGIS